ncbi:Mucin-4 [Gossypium arboreum]|uniref:Mucin-4 n=1 Tax=Gossypium arboreum TaxID=29729 RepID=A0A0B0NVQ0_GOSAR|nr:Mucin-4 [Gossypium arboreum]
MAGQNGAPESSLPLSVCWPKSQRGAGQAPPCRPPCTVAGDRKRCLWRGFDLSIGAEAVVDGTGASG